MAEGTMIVGTLTDSTVNNIDRFWGPFADLQSRHGHNTGPKRLYSQTVVTFSEALSSQLGKNNISHFSALAARTKGPVLQVGCDMGPLLQSLARAGCEITVLDRCLQIQEALLRLLASFPEDVRGRIKLVRRDPAEFDLEQTFPLIIVPFFTLGFMTEREMRQAALRQVAHHLAAKGILAFAYPIFKAQQSELGNVINTELLVEGRMVPGKLGWISSGDSQYLCVNSSSELREEDGTQRHYLDAVQIPLVSHKEVEDMLAGAGLAIIERHCSTEDNTEYHVVQCKRRADVTYPLWHPFIPINGIEENVTMFVEGKGCKVRDSQGKEYIDASGGLWNTYCGLGEPEIIQAITEQLHRLSYGTLFAWRGNEPALKLARELVALAPSPLQYAYLTGSGSESVEVAIKIARLYNLLRGRKGGEIVYLEESYHGTFFGSMSLSGLVPVKDYVGPMLPGVSSIPTPNSLRCPRNVSYSEFALSCAQALEERATKGSVAAFIVEPVLGSAGVVILGPEYFHRIEQICRKHDILLILDEVATGFGRTGRWFAAEHYGLRPDIMLLSKGMNSGYLPVGAVLFSAEIGESLARRGAPLFHGSTYNGHPACCAAALATIALMQRKGLVNRAAQCGLYFRDRLESLKLAAVGEIRALGLMLAVVLVQEDGTPAAPKQVYEVFTALKRAGVLVYAGPSTVVFCPAFVITHEEIDVVAEQLRTVLTGMRLQNGVVEVRTESATPGKITLAQATLDETPVRHRKGAPSTKVGGAAAD